MLRLESNNTTRFRKISPHIPRDKWQICLANSTRRGADGVYSKNNKRNGDETIIHRQQRAMERDRASEKMAN